MDYETYRNNEMKELNILRNEIQNEMNSMQYQNCTDLDLDIAIKNVQSLTSKDIIEKAERLQKQLLC